MRSFSRLGSSTWTPFYSTTGNGALGYFDVALMHVVVSANTAGASLDDAIEFLADDELLEVTPKAYRIRKRVLGKQDRDRLIGQRKRAAAEA